MLSLEKVLLFPGKSYLEQEFFVPHKTAGNDGYSDVDHIRLLDLRQQLKNNYFLTSSCGKEVEEIDKARIICPMYKNIIK